MTKSLSSGAIDKIIKSDSKEESTEPHTLQVIEIRNAPVNQMIRVLLSQGDGKYIDANIPFVGIETNTVVDIKKYRLRKIGKALFLSVSELTIDPSFPKVLIGDPTTNVSSDASASVFRKMAKPLSDRPSLPTDSSVVASTVSTASNGGAAEFKAPPPGLMASSAKIDPAKCTPLAELSGSNYRGKMIMVNVFKRTADKPFLNSPGHKFTADLRDTNGDEVRITFFGDTATMFDEKIVEGVNYVVTGFGIKPRNAQWNPLKGDWELNAYPSTTFLETRQEMVFQPPVFEFRKLDTLVDCKKGEVVDIVGIIIKCDDPRTSSKDGTSSSCRRVITLADDTNSCIEVTMWGEADVRKTEGEDALYHVAALKGNVSYYNQKASINCASLYLDLEDEALGPLKEWFAENKAERHTLESRCNKITTLNTITTSEALGGETRNSKQIQSLKKTMVNDGKKVYSVLMATVTSFDIESKTSPWYYMACPEPRCTKRLNVNRPCVGCAKVHQTGIPRYSVHVEISDNSGGLSCVISGHVAEKLLGISAEQMLNKETESGKPFNNSTFGSSIRGKTYNFKVQSYAYEYGAEQALMFRCDIVDFLPAVGGAPPTTPASA